MTDEERFNLEAELANGAACDECGCEPPSLCRGLCWACWSAARDAEEVTK